MKKLFCFITVLFFFLGFSKLSFAADPIIPKVDDFNKNIPTAPKNINPAPLPSDSLQNKTDNTKNTELLKVLVKEFVFEGNKKFPTSELQDLVKNKLNKELTYADLREVLQDISFYYRSKGYLATAYLPEQSIESGIIVIRVAEGVIGKIVINYSGKDAANISEERIKKFIYNKINRTTILNITQLDNNIRNLNNVPGINVIAQLQEGSSPGQVDVIVTSSNTNTVSALASMDNNGSRSSGYERLTNVFNFDSLFNWGERFSFTNVISEGSHYYAMNSTLPVGYDGLQSTFRISKLEYDLSEPFDSTNPTGYSTEFNLTFSKPLIFQTGESLTSSISFSRNDYVNDVKTGNSSNKDIIKSVANLNYNKQDRFFSGGNNSLNLGFTYGTLNLKDNMTNYDTDQLTTRNNGEYWKAAININRLQRINNNYSATFKFNGQYTDKNLDGAEQISLGGPTAVRAYPANEASGDQGFVSSIELNRAFSNNSVVSLFYDYGKIQLHKTAYENWNSTNSSLKNNYDLQGTGITFSYPINKSFNLQATYAKTLGNNRGKDSDGNDADGLTKNSRTLISLVGQF